MTEISNAAQSARESARQTDGRFGTQSHSEPQALAGDLDDARSAIEMSLRSTEFDLHRFRDRVETLEARRSALTLLSQCPDAAFVVCEPDTPDDDPEGEASLLRPLHMGRSSTDWYEDDPDRDATFALGSGYSIGVDRAVVVDLRAHADLSELGVGYDAQRPTRQYVADRVGGAIASIAADQVPEATSYEIVRMPNGRDVVFRDAEGRDVTPVASSNPARPNHARWLANDFVRPSTNIDEFTLREIPGSSVGPSDSDVIVSVDLTPPLDQS